MRFILACFVSCVLNPCLHAEHLIIGTLAYDPPFETAADQKGDYFGLEMDLMNEICRRLQDECTYKPLTFEQLMGETLSGAIDLAIAGITITEQRRLSYLFSLPYLKSEARLLAKSVSPINSLSDINGKRLGVEAATLFKGLAEEKFTNVKIIEYLTQTDLFQGIADDKVDMIIIDSVSAKYWVTNSSSILKIVSDPIPIGEGYGIMANVSKTALINRINRKLIDMENDGTYLSIYSRYF